MKRYLVCALALSVGLYFGNDMQAYGGEQKGCCAHQSKQKGANKTRAQSAFCICATQELLDLGFVCKYLAERREHACDPNNCDSPTAVEWWGKLSSLPQDCEVQGDCMDNGAKLTANKNDVATKNTSVALPKPVDPLYEPNFSWRIADISKIVHVDCIKIHPPDRDPIIAKVFLIFTDAHSVGSEAEGNLKKIPARVWTTGFEVEGLKPSKDADTTTPHEMYENIYYAKVGCTRYDVLVTAKDKKTAKSKK